MDQIGYHKNRTHLRGYSLIIRLMLSYTKLPIRIGISDKDNILSMNLNKILVRCDRRGSISIQRTTHTTYFPFSQLDSFNDGHFFAIIILLSYFCEAMAHHHEQTKVYNCNTEKNCTRDYNFKSSINLRLIELIFL